jgi:hypothetical protein
VFSRPSLKEQPLAVMVQPCTEKIDGGRSMYIQAGHLLEELIMQ